MADQSAAQDQAKDAEAAVATQDGKSKASVKTVTIKRYNKEIEVEGEDRIRDLVSKGFDYSEKVRELNSERDSDRKALEVGRDLQRLAQEHPDRAARIVAIANGEDASTGPATSPKGNGNLAPEVTEEDLSDAERTLLQRVRALEERHNQGLQEIQRVNSQLQQQNVSAKEQEMERSIRAEAEATGFWDKEAVEDVIPEVAAYMSAHPGASATEAVWAKVTAHKKLLEGLQKKQVASTEDKQKFRTEPPGKGTPRLRESPYDYKSKDLSSGKIVNDALEEAKGWLKNL